MSRAGAKHLLLIGFRNRRLDAAQLAEAVEEALGDALKLSSTDPDSIGSVDARVVSVPSTASRSSRISANSSGLG